jgi:haloacetate dehalogenase
MLAAPELHAKKQMRLLNNASPDSSMFDSTAYASYEALFRDPSAVHAMCEDYRAGAKEDLEEQRKELEEGRKIVCPLRVLWGKKGLVEKKFNAKLEWEKVCEEGRWDDGSEAVESGHYIPEEVPEVLLKQILEFFKE